MEKNRREQRDSERQRGGGNLIDEISMEKKENEGNRVELNRQHQQQQQIMYSRDSPFNSTCNPSMISMLLSLSHSHYSCFRLGRRR